MKGYTFIVGQMAPVLLIFSFFLPNQCWGKDPLTPTEVAQRIIIGLTEVRTLSSSTLAVKPGPGGQGGEAPPSTAADQERLKKAAQILQLLFVTVLLLLFVLIFATIAILLRRRRVLRRERPKPTVLKDLWTIEEEQKR